MRRLSLVLPFLALACSAPGGALQAEEYRWFESGWYVGGTIGTAITDASASDLDESLADKGFTTTSELDDEDTGWKGFLGYRLERYVGFELAYVELGQIESTVEAMDPVDVDALLNSLASTQPFLGEGVALSAQLYLLDTSRVDLALKGGGWFWEAEVSAVTPDDRVEVDEDGFDPLFGAFVLLDVTARAQLRAEYERYFLDGDGADFLSVGLQLRLD